jgi:hypothetical protein
MRETIFIVVGGCGLLIIIFFGRRLLFRRTTTSKQFAMFIASSFAILVSGIAIITHAIDVGWIIVSLFLLVINFGVIYPITYYYHQYMIGKHEDKN